MKSINVALVKLLQFLVFALFTFMVLAYFGAIILLPLDMVALLIQLLGIFGISGFFAAFIAVPIVGYLALMVYKTPGLIQMLLDIGIDLISTGKKRVEAFDEITKAVNV